MQGKIKRNRGAGAYFPTRPPRQTVYCFSKVVRTNLLSWWYKTKKWWWSEEIIFWRKRKWKGRGTYKLNELGSWERSPGPCYSVFKIFNFSVDVLVRVNTYSSRHKVNKPKSTTIQTLQTKAHLQASRTCTANKICDCTSVPLADRWYTTWARRESWNHSCRRRGGCPRFLLLEPGQFRP